MIVEGFQYLRTHPHLVIIPAIALSSTVISFSLVGEALAAFLNSRRRVTARAR
jgi:ABC-type dipeptide/oligopeptide/nickel transport system permease subunit